LDSPGCSRSWLSAATIRPKHSTGEKNWSALNLLRYTSIDCAQSAAWYTLWYGAACSSMASVTMAMND